MGFHLTVAGSLKPLADELAKVLATPLPSPFARELVVIPGDGVKAWINAELSNVLGATSVDPQTPSFDGIVANIDYVFPGTLLRRILGEDSGLGQWSTGPLTWAVYEVLAADGQAFGQTADAVRARGIADLFDRYTFYRQSMVRAWSENTSGAPDVDGVGQPLAAHHQWQPELWRAVQQLLGGPTDAQRMYELVHAMERGECPAHLDVTQLPRVSLFGLSSLPTTQLEVLAAVSQFIDVNVYAPAASAARWESIRDRLNGRLEWPVARTENRLPLIDGHSLLSGWGRMSLESHALLLETATRAADATVQFAQETTSSEKHPDSLLSTIQTAIRTDVAPIETARSVIDLHDHSMQIHQTYGTARQVEVVRDALLHLFYDDATKGKYTARDVAILCPDTSIFAPLVEATFAGDPEHGVPAIPVKIADRTLRADNVIFDAIGALLDMLDGRFRASEVLAFASRGPVRRKFQLDASSMGRIAEWIDATNTRWGLTEADQERFMSGITLNAYTWRDGLDQLLLGSTMADFGPRVGTGGVVPYPEIEGDDVVTAGSLADLIDTLDRTMSVLRAPSTVADWCAELRHAAYRLMAVTDKQAWLWRPVERLIAEIEEEYALIGKRDGAGPEPLVDPLQLATVVRGRLDTGGGQARFGTGAVTVSSLTAQRGVPHKIVCLLGLDGDLVNSGLTVAEDLVGSIPCIGDRDARSELRAQMLDAVLSAGEYLWLFGTGRDLRTNAELAPPVAVAELLDLVDDTVLGIGDKSASELLTLHHPRQAWSEAVFVATQKDQPAWIGPWSFDEGALRAATIRRNAMLHFDALSGQQELAEPVPVPVGNDVGAPGVPVPLQMITKALTNPARVFLQDRLRFSSPTDSDSVTDVIPLSLTGLARWKLADELIEARFDRRAEWTPTVKDAWVHAEQKRGAVPPLAFGGNELNELNARMDVVQQLLSAELEGGAATPESIAIDLSVPRDLAGVTRIEGVIEGIYGDVLVLVTASKLKPRDRLTAWVQLAALSAHDPSRQWRALLIGDDGNGGVASARVELSDSSMAPKVLTTAVDLFERSMCDAIPFFPATSEKFVPLNDHSLKNARSAWEGDRGESTDKWVRQLFAADFASLTELPVRESEKASGWASGSRVERWAQRIWGTYSETVSEAARVSADDVDATDSDGGDE